MTRPAPLVTLALLLTGARASAEPPPWLARYDVALECPAASTFVEGVARRVSRPLDLAFAGARLELSIERDRDDPNGLLGQLRVASASAGESTRSVRARSCRELLEALSLVAALAASAERRTSDAPLSAPGEAASVVPAEPRDVPPLPPESTSRDGFRLGPNAYMLVQDAATPEPELGVGLALALAWPKHGHWAPWLQIGAYRLQSGENSIGSGAIRARFDLTAAHLVACPLRWSVSEAWSFRPCVELDVGRLHGSGGGSAISHATEHAGAWVSSGLSLRAELEPWEPVRLSASFGAVLPWNRHEFFFAPDVVAFAVPDLGFRGTFSGAVLF